MIRDVYQTLENREIDGVEINGPFLCDRSNAWLGPGYYFWDSHKENAHWWGKEVAKYPAGYIICKSTITFDDKCFDLHDNPDHQRTFNKMKDMFLEKGLLEEGQTTVGRIMNFIKTQIDSFPFEAIRAYAVNSKGYKSSFNQRTRFVHKEYRESNQYLDTLPAIQICLFTKNSLDRKGYSIVYPPEYSKGYVV